MSQNIEKEKSRKIDKALQNIIPSDYGVYVSGNSLTIDDFYKLKNQNGGVVLIVYNKGLNDEQKNQFTVICVQRKHHRIVWCNTQGLILNCQAYEFLCNLKHKDDRKFFACTQLRYKCENNNLLNNMAFMFYLVEMLSKNKKFGVIPSDHDIITQYIGIMPEEILQSGL